MADFEELKETIARDLLLLRLQDRVLSLVKPPPRCVMHYRWPGDVYFHYRPRNDYDDYALIRLGHSPLRQGLHANVAWYRPATKAWTKFAADLEKAAAQAQMELTP